MLENEYLREAIKNVMSNTESALTTAAYGRKCLIYPDFNLNPSSATPILNIFY